MKLTTRIAVAAAVLVAAVGLMSWLVPGRGAALAFVNVAEALSNVQSARWKSTTVTKQPQAEPVTEHKIGMFLAPSRERIETAVPGVPGAKSIAILEGRKALFLNPMLKQATVVNVKINIEGFPREAGPWGRTFLDLRETAVAAQSGKLGEAKPLGTQVVDGRRAVGFRMQHDRAQTTIWADPKTSLPIRVEYAISGDTEIHTVMTDFEIDPDLDESLFSLEVPEGYTLLDTLRLDIPKTPLISLARTLGMAAELNDGVFPSALLGEQGHYRTLPRLGQAYIEKKYGKDFAAFVEKKVAKASAGMSQAEGDRSDLQKELADMRREALVIPATIASTHALLRNLSPKHDWHYAGKDVKLNTPNRPIFWMKDWLNRPTKGGKYEVIYADLSVKEVGPEDVPKVPASEGSPKQ